MMNKTKRELFEENKKLKEEKKLYQQYWEVDLLQEQQNTLLTIKKICHVLTIIFLCCSCFLIGLMW